MITLERMFRLPLKPLAKVLFVAPASSPARGLISLNGVRARSSRSGENALAKVLESFVAPAASRGRLSLAPVGFLPSLLQGFDEPRMFPTSSFNLTSPDDKSYHVALAVPGIKPAEISVKIVDKHRLEVEVISDKEDPTSIKSIREKYMMELPEDASFDAENVPQAKLVHGELTLNLTRRERTVVDVPVVEG